MAATPYRVALSAYRLRLQSCCYSSKNLEDGLQLPSVVDAVDVVDVDAFATVCCDLDL